VRLLERTTRHVTPTLDGEAYRRRCLALIADLEDAEGAFGGASLRGCCVSTSTARWRAISCCHGGQPF
jgi:DNA-binding transcriptional LysR family regulator